MAPGPWVDFVAAPDYASRVTWSAGSVVEFQCMDADYNTQGCGLMVVLEPGGKALVFC